MPEEKEVPAHAPKKRRRWKRWTLLGLLTVLVASLLVLNGPGWRWIAAKVAARYLPDLGLTGTVEFEGTLSNGEILLKGVDLKGDGAVRQVKLDQVVLRYRPGRVIHGEIEAVRIDGLHADLDLDRPWPGAKPKEDKPTDLSKISETLRNLRQRIVPVAADVSDLQVRVTRSGQPVFALAKMDLAHPGGADRFTLTLGELVFGPDRKLPAQETALVWKEDAISVEKALLLPGLTLEGVTASLPASGSLSYDGRIRVAEALFAAQGTLENGEIKLAEGALNTRQVAEILGVAIPAEGTLELLEAKVTGISGGAKTLEGTVAAGLRGVAYQDWRVDAIRLDGSLNGETVLLDANAQAMGSPWKITTKTGVNRAQGFQLRNAEAAIAIPNAAAVLNDLRSRMEGVKPLGPIPPSTFQTTATASFKDGRIAGAKGRAILTPTDPATASPLDLTAAWAPAGPLDAGLVVEGAKVNAVLDFEKKGYQGRAAFEDFTPDRLAAWLAAFGVTVPPQMQLRGTWEGQGTFGPKDHRGKATIANFTAAKIEGGPLVASGDVDYDWPRAVEIRGLTATQAQQKIVTNARLRDQLLTLEELQWSDGAEVLLKGKASVPVTENPGDWKALLKQTRPLAINIESTEIPLAKLHPFLGPEVRFAEKARGKVVLHVTGTPAAPVIEGELLGRDLGIVSQATAPKADLELKFRTVEENFELEGTLVTPGYPAANLSAKLPFRPGVWMEHPEVLKEEKLDAAARVPNLELARFASLVPGVKKLAGSLKADITVKGTIGKPDLLGEVELKGGAVTLNSPEIEPITGIAFKASATPQAIDLQRLALQIESGTVDGRGKLTLANGKPEAVDFTLRGRALPLKRDDSMIIRANLDLAARGPWANATVSGTVAIVDSLFYRDIELLPIGVPFNQPSAPSLPAIDVAKRADTAAAIPEPFRNWAVSVKAVTANPFLVRGNLATGEATLNVNITGTLGNPAPRGQAIMKDVSAKLPFSTLYVDEGTVDFRPEAPFDPTLNIRGRSTIRPYEVNLYVYGPVSDPKVLTTSSPPLPESEIMTLLATGTTTRGIADPQAAMTRGAQLLIEEFRRGRIRYARRLQPVLKLLDRVDFQIGEENRYSGQKMNSATINLSDNWLISAGVGDEGNSRVTLMYLIRFR